eukprot:Lithocolla_globosa_v1_NODE_5544_length_1222_cov_2.972579.p1 type:complete len:353 gc:universal NODE_5544_length_1222_cov_2.972579:133-1191(+)
MFLGSPFDLYSLIVLVGFSLCLALFFSALALSIIRFFSSKIVGEEGVLIFTTVVSALLVGIIVITLSVAWVAIDWRTTPENYCPILTKMLAFFYVMVNYFMYLFLYQKQHLLAKATCDESRRLEQLCMLGTQGVPVFAVICVWMLDGEIWNAETGKMHCVQIMPWWLTLMLLLIDSCLSVCWIVLFWKRLSDHMSDCLEEQENKWLLKKNLVLCVIAMLSTGLSMFLCCFANAANEKELGWYSMLSVILGIADTTVNLCMILLTTRVWLPPPLTPYFFPFLFPEKGKAARLTVRMDTLTQLKKQMYSVSAPDEELMSGVSMEFGGVGGRSPVLLVASDSAGSAVSHGGGIAV